MSIIHDFRDCLHRSFDLSSEPSWVEFYRDLFGEELLEAIRIDDDSKFQRWGCDRMLLFKNGNQLLVDEKKRAKDYGDFLAEIWSVGHMKEGKYVGQKLGWTVDDSKRCHYVAYAVVPAARCYLLPSDLLRLTTKRNFARWKNLKIKGYPAWPKDSLNVGYVTRNCAVEWDELRRCMYEYRTFGSSIQLPTPIIGEQGELFEWGKIVNSAEGDT